MPSELRMTLTAAQILHMYGVSLEITTEKNILSHVSQEPNFSINGHNLPCHLVWQIMSYFCKMQPIAYLLIDLMISSCSFAHDQSFVAMELRFQIRGGRNQQH